MNIVILVLLSLTLLVYNVLLIVYFFQNILKMLKILVFDNNNIKCFGKVEVTLIGLSYIFLEEHSSIMES